MNKTKFTQWKYYFHNLENNILTKNDISLSLNSFWKDVVSKLDNKQNILIIFKIRDSAYQYKSISNVSLNTKSNKDLLWLKNAYIEYWELKNEEYQNIEISSIIYYYKILSDKINNEVNTSKIKELKKVKLIKKINKFNLLGYNLPSTMDITEWGNIHFYRNYTKAIVFKLNSKIEYHVSLYSTYQVIELKIDDKLLLTFTDYIKDVNNLSSFERKINNQRYIFEEGILTYKEILRKVPFLKKIKPSIYPSKNIITMDLEARIINNIMEPYCISIYDGKIFSNFYLGDYSNSIEMLNAAILSIMKRKYNGYRVYLHNFSNFDAIFLIKILTNLSDEIKPIIRDNKILDIKFKFASYTIYFRDSYLLLPLSLAKLAISFNVENKTIFPYLVLNENNISLNYEGKVPDFKYFTNITKEEYFNYCNSFVNKTWNLKYESLKYCNQDVKTLYQVIDKFSEHIFVNFRLDIVKYPTLSSLAFAIYRSKFLNEYKIPLITGTMFNDISSSYSGGTVDVYKPIGENLYHYDVNSLYPYVMKDFPMPVGLPYYFEGDIFSVYKRPFGFFEVEIETPNKLNIPLLQTRKKTNSGTRTVTPLGKWKGMYFSEEIYKAMEYGYKFKVIRGYIFDKEYIFKDYVNYLYEWKVQSEKNSPNYIISKLLLNSLYGRFGMNENATQHAFINEDESFEYYRKFEVVDVIEIENGKELISYIDNSIDTEDNYKLLNISIPVASAITAYSRIVMYSYKNIPYIIVYYTDTDSIVINKPLPENLVGNEIGKMKLEHISKKAIFLAPKVYGFITNKNEEIVKIKGAKNIIPFNELYDLLNKDKKITIYQDKWYKNINEGNIYIKKEIYTLMATCHKRNFIYDSNNKIIDTSPICFNDID